MSELPLGKIADTLIKELEVELKIAQENLHLFQGAIEGVKALVVRIHEHVKKESAPVATEVTENGPTE